MPRFSITLKMALLGSFLPFMMMAGPNALAGWFDPYTVQTDIPYGPDAATKADLYIPRANGPHPALVYIHGGAWSGGDKAWADYQARMYARAGIAVININYRLAKMGHPETLWPAQLQDVQLAVRWVRKYAARLRVDSRRICAAGDSAGGHLSLFLGSLKQTSPGDRASLYADQSPRVSCVVNMFGPANLTNPVMAQILDAPPFLGGKKLEQAPELWRDASPFFLLNSESAPTYTIQGKEDPIVPLPVGRELDAALKQKGVFAPYFEVDGGHVFINTPPEQKRAAEQGAVEFVRRQLQF